MYRKPFQCGSQISIKIIPWLSIGLKLMLNDIWGFFVQTEHFLASSTTTLCPFYTAGICWFLKLLVKVSAWFDVWQDYYWMPNPIRLWWPTLSPREGKSMNIPRPQLCRSHKCCFTIYQTLSVFVCMCVWGGGWGELGSWTCEIITFIKFLGYLNIRKDVWGFTCVCLKATFQSLPIGVGFLTQPSRPELPKGAKEEVE